MTEFEQTLILAEKGDAKAQFELSFIYSDGKIVNKDEEKSLYWLRTSAIGGNTDAIFNFILSFYKEYKDFHKILYGWCSDAKRGKSECFDIINSIRDYIIKNE